MGDYCEEKSQNTFCQMHTANSKIYAMVWGCIFSDGIGPSAKMEGGMNGKDYLRLLSKTYIPTLETKLECYKHKNLTELEERVKDELSKTSDFVIQLYNKITKNWVEN